MSKYETFKKCAIAIGGIAGAIGTIYFTTIYLPAKIISTATAATTAAMNASLGSTVAGWFSGTVADTAAVAGAEAYIAAKTTGFVGVSYPAIFSSFGVGYAVGSKAVEYTFTGMEKVYEGVSSLADKWTKKVEEEKVTQENIIQNRMTV